SSHVETEVIIEQSCRIGDIDDFDSRYVLIRREINEAWYLCATSGNHRLGSGQVAIGIDPYLTNNRTSRRIIAHLHKAQIVDWRSKINIQLVVVRIARLVGDPVTWGANRVRLRGI